MCNWGSPAFDLYYIAAVIPYSKREKLFKLYFDTFIDVLVKSGFQGNLPTYELLQKEMKRYQSFGNYDACFEESDALHKNCRVKDICA